MYQALFQLHTIMCPEHVKSDILFHDTQVATHEFVTDASLYQVLSV